MYNFIQDETGAVTVDWVVLTAALVGLGLAVMAVVSGGVQNQSNDMDAMMRSDQIIKTSFTGSIQGALSGACAAAGADCSGFLTGSDLSTASRADLDAAITSAALLDDTSGFDSTGLSQNGAGEWGVADTSDPDPANHTFTVDTAATQDYNRRSANETYQASLGAEQSARVVTPDPAPTN